MEANHIPLIMQRLAQIVADDRIRKYSTALIVKIIVILKIYGVSYRSSKYFFNNHKEFMELLNIKDIPNFRTLSYRSLRIDWHLRVSKHTSTHDVHIFLPETPAILFAITVVCNYYFSYGYVIIPVFNIPDVLHFKYFL